MLHTEKWVGIGCGVKEDGSENKLKVDINSVPLDPWILVVT